MPTQNPLFSLLAEPPHKPSPRAKPVDLEIAFLKSDELEETNKFSPPKTPESFIAPSSFDEGLFESEDEIARAFEEIYGPAYSGETFLVHSVHEMDSKVKGGKQMHFKAVVVVRDKHGNVGVGVGKAKVVVAAVQKAIISARRNIVAVPIGPMICRPAFPKPE